MRPFCRISLTACYNDRLTVLLLKRKDGKESGLSDTAEHRNTLLTTANCGVAIGQGRG